MRTTNKWLVLVLVVGLILTACSSDPDTADTTVSGAETTEPTEPDEPGEPVATTEARDSSKEGGTLVLSYLSEPDTLDPHRTVAPNAEIVLRLIGASLIEVDPDTGDLVPAVLVSWESSDDGLLWTLKIRPDVTFHSGKNLTADDLKATWERGLEDGSTIGPLLGDVAELIVVDEETLQVRHATPLAGFAKNLASTFLQPIDPEALALGDEDYGSHPASVGPYIFQDRVVDSHITLVRNPDYSWPAAFYENQGPAYPDEIVIRNIREAATRMASLETGEVQIAILSAGDVDRLTDDLAIDVQNFLRTGISTVAWINHEAPPLDDVLVRRAINFAFDRETIAQIALDGKGEAAYWPVPPWSEYYSDEVEDLVERYDPAQANTLLDEAGWELGADGIRSKDGETLSLTLFSQAIPAWENASAIMQSNLEDVGVDLAIEVYDGPTMRQYSREGRHDLAFLGYGGDEMNSLTLHFHSSQIDPETGWNMSNYNNPALDALLEEQARTVDPEERNILAAEIQQVMVEDVAVVPLLSYRNYWGAHEQVMDFRVSQMVGKDADALLLHDVWVEKS